MEALQKATARAEEIVAEGVYSHPLELSRDLIEETLKFYQSIGSLREEVIFDLTLMHNPDGRGGLSISVAFIGSAPLGTAKPAARLTNMGVDWASVEMVR